MLPPGFSADISHEQEHLCGLSHLLFSIRDREKAAIARQQDLVKAQVAQVIEKYPPRN